MSMYMYVCMHMSTDKIPTQSFVIRLMDRHIPWFPLQQKKKLGKRLI